MSIASRLKKPLRRVRRIASDELIAAWPSMPVRKGTVLYESFSGNGMLCNPEAVFRCALADPDLGHLRHTWVLSDFEDYRATVEHYSRHPRVSFVRYRSPQYFRELATSQYVVNNSTFPYEFVKRPEQTYLNTWHGVPLKAMGYDMPGGAYESRNVLRNFVSADFLLSANRFMTERMYRDAYRLGGFYQGKIIETGQPRTDHQMTDAAGVRRELVDSGVSVGDGPIVLYAPTWRGGSFHAASPGLHLVLQALTELRHAAADVGATVLVKLHQQVYARVKDNPTLAGCLVPNAVLTNRLLAATDVLVTDYSSIFFDYLSLDRPVVFYVPDLAEYSRDRGWYLDVGMWPGAVTRTPDELSSAAGDALGGLEAAHLVERRQAGAVEYCRRDDGGASQRVVDIVFKGAGPSDDLVDLSATEKRKILLYLGGMQSNGITTSALGLLDNLDLTRVDVSVLYAETRDRRIRSNVDMINPGVRQFVRVGRMLSSRVDKYGRHVVSTRGDVEFLGRSRTLGLYDREWRRLFGNSRFDHVIDFSGYASHWALILLASGAPRASVWMHNDLAAEVHKEVDGKRPHENSLRALFTLYQQFDHLVSVSPALAEINRQKLSAYAPPERFTSVVNTLVTARIDAGRWGPEIGRPRSPGTTIEVTDLAATVDSLLEQFDERDLSRYLEHRRLLDRWMPDRGRCATFIAVGRLSPEKNFDRLIRAFHIVHRERPDTRLVILGEGPLRPALDGLVAELGLTTAVALAGYQSNPYALMEAADCFVMSSDYEGQPMVILEARYLGRPIVTTNFGSVSSALAEDEGLIVERSVEALADGLRVFLEGAVPSKPFDPEAYNAEALEQFYRIVEA